MYIDENNLSLKWWLFLKDKSIKKFACEAEVSAALISKYLAGKARISKRIAKCIFLATNGDVKIDKLLEDNSPKEPKEKVPDIQLESAATEIQQQS